MSGCIYKRSDGRCDKPGRYLSPCIGEACQHQTPSNADRIRAMSDEELADMFGEHSKRRDCCPNYGSYDCRATCEECWLDWLKSPEVDG